MNRFISYDGLPTNSGGAHRISKKSPKENYQNTINFLKRYADNMDPETIELTLYDSQNKDYSTIELLPNLNQKFGKPKMQDDGWLKTWNWKLSEKDIEKGFEILLLNNNLPNNPAGPLNLNFLWHFHFKDPKTNQVLPNQDLIPELDIRIKNSRIYLRISKKSTISVWFALPFEQLDNYEIEFINELKNHIPFKISNKHWRIWTKSGKGNWTPRKIQV